ncbi:Hydroxysteroid dehydrogenase-like protein 2 [Smittium mucronatum]|uniref:Hydroxysteroid dehydrogenase-like protein 2 n=1 Tax=Smittium mucronatum TaxID=133383 RepID=A0A1R0GNF2_9FUNG|nr:Hydroxysteroid dehydrogenase-like protein 2 [Smittium mucronatum]
MQPTLKDKVLFITGASRGIGLAIALRAARDGAKIAIVAKTTEPHPTLPGTIYTAAKEIEKAGGTALAIKCDIRFEDQIQAAFQQTVDRFGSIDIVICNASAVYMGTTETTPSSRMDLMYQINVRGTLLVAKHAIPYLKESSNPHILIASPPINLQQIGWNVSYTVTKYGMSLASLGLSQELKPYGIAVNSIWPFTSIETAALKVTDPSKRRKFSRSPEIMADAVHSILVSDSKTVTGNLFIDEVVLRKFNNYTNADFDKYSVIRNPTQLSSSFFLSDEMIDSVVAMRNSSKL